jgi:hypothetical protein
MAPDMQGNEWTASPAFLREKNHTSAKTPALIFPAEGAIMQQASSGQTRKKSILVAGLGGAFVAAGITAAMLASNPSPPATPVQTAEPTANTCQQREPRMQLVSTGNGGGGTVRFRAGDYLSPPITLGSSPQPVVFPKLRPEKGLVNETIIVEGDATNLLLGPVGSQVVIPRVQGTYSYLMTWAPKKC